LLKECSLPITGLQCVKKIVTDLGVFEITEHGFLLTEIAPNVTVEEVKSKTEGKLQIADNLFAMSEH
jgi:3-oxoacid CoA-transferase subunit B